MITIMMSHPLRFLFLLLAGWANRKQQDVIVYLQEENRLLREQHGVKRLRFTDNQRRLSLPKIRRPAKSGTYVVTSRLAFAPRRHPPACDPACDRPMLPAMIHVVVFLIAGVVHCIRVARQSGIALDDGGDSYAGWPPGHETSEPSCTSRLFCRCNSMERIRRIGF